MELSLKTMVYWIAGSYLGTCINGLRPDQNSDKPVRQHWLLYGLTKGLQAFRHKVQMHFFFMDSCCERVSVPQCRIVAVWTPSLPRLLEGCTQRNPAVVDINILQPHVLFCMQNRENTKRKGNLKKNLKKRKKSMEFLSCACVQTNAKVLTVYDNLNMSLNLLWQPFD